MKTAFIRAVEAHAAYLMDGFPVSKETCTINAFGHECQTHADRPTWADSRAALLAAEAAPVGEKIAALWAIVE